MLPHGFLHFRVRRPSRNTVNSDAKCDFAGIDLGCVGDVPLSIYIYIYVYIYIYIFSKASACASLEVFCDTLLQHAGEAASSGRQRGGYLKAPPLPPAPSLC